MREAETNEKMLCLDIKLVSRLRGVSSSSAAGSTSPTHSAASAAIGTEKSKCRKTRRENGDAPAVAVISDNEEESLRPPCASVQEMIRRNRSRSVCVAAILPSSQHLRQLHRRASHHVYVITVSEPPRPVMLLDARKRRLRNDYGSVPSE